MAKKYEGKFYVSNQITKGDSMVLKGDIRVNAENINIADPEIISLLSPRIKTNIYKGAPIQLASYTFLNGLKFEAHVGKEHSFKLTKIYYNEDNVVFTLVFNDRFVHVTYRENKFIPQLIEYIEGNNFDFKLYELEK